MTNKPILMPSRMSGKTNAGLQQDIVRQATRLLLRYRNSFPLPVDRLELYRASFPKWVIEAVESSPAREMLEHTEWNVLSALPGGRYLHYRLCGRDQEKTDDSNVFWVRFDQNIITGNSEALLVPPIYSESIGEWFAAVREADQEIYQAKMHVNAAAGVVSSQAELLLLWPDLAKAVHMRVSSPGAGVRDVKRLKSRFESAVGPIDKRHTSDLLAKCLLLPDTGSSAWAGRQWSGTEAQK